MRIYVNYCKCQSPAEGLVIKIERYGQRLTQGYCAHGGSYSWAPFQVHYPRVFPGAHSLAKKPEESGYEIAGNPEPGRVDGRRQITDFRLVSEISEI